MGGELLAAIAVGGLLLAAKLGEDAASRLRVPAFIGAMLAGLALGEAGAGLISGEILGEISLVLLIGINFTLFVGGVEELSNPRLVRPKGGEIVDALYIYSTTSIPLTLFFWRGLGFELYTSILYASAISMSSLGPLFKVLLEAEHGFTSKAVSALRIGLVLELLGLIVFNTFYYGVSLYSLVATPLFVLGVVFLGRKYLARTLRVLERAIIVREAPFALIVALILVAGYIAEIIGFNAAITALLLGLFASDYLYERPAYLERLRAFTYGFLEPLFFAGIGLYASKPSTTSLLLAAYYTAAVLPPRVLVALHKGFSLRESAVLAAKGGVDAAMLLALLLDNKIGGEAYSAGVFSIIALTLVSAASAKSRGRSPELWRMKLGEVELGHDAVYYREKASYAARLLEGRRALVVVGEGYRPVGYIVAEDLVGLSLEALEAIPVSLLARLELPIASSETLVADLLADPSILHEPIIAVVDSSGKLAGTITPQQLLKITLTSPRTSKNL